MTDVYYEIKYDGNKTQKISELSPLEKALVALGDFRRTRRTESFLRATNEVVEPLSEGGLDFKKLTYFYAAVKQPLCKGLLKVSELKKEFCRRLLSSCVSIQLKIVN